MRLRRSINLALATLVVALGVVAWYAARGPAGAPPLTETQPRELTKLELIYPRANRPALTLERRSDGWWLTRPVERRARDGRVVSALAAVSAPAGDCYAAADHEPAAFGLATPRLRLDAGQVTVAFGDRAADGRRYVRAGERFCLLADRYYPLLQNGLESLADRSVLAGTRPTRIATPAGEARRDGDSWRLVHGTGDAATWAARWRGARAERIMLDAPDDDLGRVRIATGDGIREWRIAAREPAPILVPRGATYGLVFAADAPAPLLAPPPETDARTLPDRPVPAATQPPQREPAPRSAVVAAG